MLCVISTVQDCWDDARPSTGNVLVCLYQPHPQVQDFWVHGLAKLETFGTAAWLFKIQKSSERHISGQALVFLYSTTLWRREGKGKGFCPLVQRKVLIDLREHSDLEGGSRIRQDHDHIEGA